MVRILKLVISMGFYVGCRIWSWNCRIKRKKLPGTCVVLYYHAVTSKQRSKFARQMDDLIRYAKPVLADTTNPLKSGVHHAVVTFDDGFQSVFENALPELIQRKIPSTIFIPTGYLGRHAEWDSDPESQDCHEKIMTVDQLRKLPSDLVSIGSHTVTHHRLPLLGEEEARRELVESRQELESILGCDTKLFSFPYGEYNRVLIEWSRQAGYKRVFTILPILAFSEPEEYVTGRIMVTPTDWRLEFRLKLLGAYCWLPLAFALKRKMYLMISKYLAALML
jgi:peptidoglycan/xylan/chitin deacetylase (PgdA/CDA1 family)